MPTIRIDDEVHAALADERDWRHERNWNPALMRVIAAQGRQGGNDMELMVCIDGAEHATIDLRDGDDQFNREAERGALDRAYEAKESNPDSVVTIVLSGWELLPLDPEPDHIFIADNLTYLAEIDEGEHTDDERLESLAKALRDGSLRLTGGDAGDPETGAKLGIQPDGDLLAVPKPRPLGEWSTQHADDCPVTRHRAELLVEIGDTQFGTDRMAYLMGAVPEYDLGGDQEVELCTCGTAGRMGPWPGEEVSS